LTYALRRDEMGQVFTEGVLMHDRLIERIRWRIGGLLALKGSLIGLTAWVFLWGTFVVAWRVWRREAPDWLWWGAAAAPMVVALATYLAWRRTPGTSAVRAFVDRYASCGGLLMASEVQPLGLWQNTLPSPADISIRWRGRGAATAFVASVAFLLAAFLVPQSIATWADPGLEIGNDVHKLTGAIEMLKEEKIMEQARVDFLKDKLKQIQDDASGRNPKKTFDALDNIRDSLSRAAQQAAEGAIQKAEKLGKSQGLAEALGANDGSLDPKLQKEAMTELAGLLEKALDENDFADLDLDPDLLKECLECKLSPDDLKKLGKAMKAARGGLSKKLDKLTKARLIDPSLLKECENAGECDACKDGKCDALALAKILNGKRGGRGGVTEGPGHNELAWTDGTDESGAKFKEMALPPGSLSKLRESIKVGVAKAQPTEANAVASQSGAIQNSAAGGGGANSNVVLPQHRAAVQRFFERPKQ
jgi:hypothetical protein